MQQRNNEGFILITVLLVIAVLFPLILMFNAKVQLNLIQAENFRNSVQAIRMARSGVEGAIGILKQDDASFDSKRDKWASPFPGLSLGNGILAVTINDEDAKIPINNLVGTVKDNSAQTAAAQGTTGSSTQAAAQSTTGKVVNDQIDQDLNARLRALITKLGGKPEIVDALIDWMDSNNEVTGSEGAEDDYYRQKGYRCKNGPLDSIEELSLVKGFDKEWLVDKDLKSYLTVAPTDGKVNANTSSLMVLQTVLETRTTGLAQPLPDGDVQDLVRYRDEHDLKTMNDLTAAVKISQTQAATITPLVKVNSTYFNVRSRYTIGRVVKNVEALLKRDSSTVTTISWREF